MMKKKSIKASKKHSKRMKEVDDEDEEAENSGQEDASMFGDTNQDDASISSSGGGDVGNDSSSDYEETKSSRSGKKKKTKSTTTTMKIEETNNRRRRSTTTSKSSGKMAKHLRDQHAKARRRQMEEVRIRREELGHLADGDDDDVDADDNGEEGTKKKTKKLLLTGDDDNTKDEAEDNESKIPKMSEEDRQRAQAIAARFDTNRDELRVKRIEDRVGLIDRLRTKRLELISSSLSEDEEDKLTIADLAGKNKQEEEQMHRPKLTSTNNVGPRTNDMQSDPVGDDDDEKSRSSSSSNDDSDNEESEDDLEIIAQPNAPSASGCSSNMTSSTAKRTSTVDLVFQPSSNHQNRSANRKDPQKKASKPSANPLMALQNALRAKVLNSGNRWLAR